LPGIVVVVVPGRVVVVVVVVVVDVVVVDVVLVVELVGTDVLVVGGDVQSGVPVGCVPTEPLLMAQVTRRSWPGV
jgi:hypothetical protein